MTNRKRRGTQQFLWRSYRQTIGRIKRITKATFKRLLHKGRVRTR